MQPPEVPRMHNCLRRSELELRGPRSGLTISTLQGLVWGGALLGRRAVRPAIPLVGAPLALRSDARRNKLRCNVLSDSTSPGSGPGQFAIA
eukprot:13985498-Alexandrium_andersonii.AAC.1